MERTDIERLSKMEEKVENVCKSVDKIDKKLDNFIEILDSKADQTELDSIKNKFLTYTISIIVGLLGVCSGLIVYIFQHLV